MLRGSLVVFVAGLIVFGCGDETTINNYSLTDTGIIVGSITPFDIGSTVQLDSLVPVLIPAGGDFVFTQVPMGGHVITIEPVNYSPRRISQVEVWPSQVHYLKEITLTTLPYPVFRTFPEDGDSGVSAVKIYGIEIEADESLDTADLNAGTSIEPPINGRWHGPSDSVRARSSYSFYIEDTSTQGGGLRPPRMQRALRVGTTYHVTIDGSVRTAFGVPLGRDIEFSFTTEPLEVFASIPYAGLEGGVKMGAFIPVLNFNDSVNIDSVAKAVSFVPAIEGVWIAREDENEVSFLPSGGLLPPSTEYMMIVSDDVPLSGVAHLEQPDTTFFTTEPVGVTSSSPCNGCAGGSYIRLEFNAPMDTASVSSAFELTSASGDTVEVEFHWDTFNRPFRQLSVIPQRPMAGGVIYRYVVSRDARSAAGYPIYKAVEVYFLAN